MTGCRAAHSVMHGEDRGNMRSTIAVTTSHTGLHGLHENLLARRIQRKQAGLVAMNCGNTRRKCQNRQDTVQIKTCTYQ
eukprot:4346273-Pleurochrysis_carterae.AAC.1